MNVAIVVLVVVGIATKIFWRDIQLWLLYRMIRKHQKEQAKHEEQVRELKRLLEEDRPWPRR